MSIETIKFRGRHVPKTALFMLITGGLALILLIVMIIIASVTHSESVAGGITGCIAAVLSLVGLILSAFSLYERDIYTAVPIAGMIVNGVSLLAYLIIYTLGRLA